MAKPNPGIDPHRLRPADLLRLVNSAGTGDGGVALTESQLRRHRNQAGYGIADPRSPQRIDLFRYAAWLTLEHLAPKTETVSYEEQKARQAERNADAVRSAQEIGELPAVADPERKANACRSFRGFCEAYFPDVFYLPWSPDHDKVIAKIERAVLNGGLFAVAIH